MMKTRAQNYLRFHPGVRWPGPAKLCFAAALMSALGISAASAANVSLTTSDAAGSTSYNSAGHWSNAAAPSGANNYFTTNFTLRSPNPTSSGNNYIFLGNSLSIDTGGRFLCKIGNNVGGNTNYDIVTVTNLVLNGGAMDQAGANSDSSTMVVAGGVTVNAASSLGALGGTANNSTSFETLEFAAPISGNGFLLVSGAALNAGADTGLVKLSAANPYGGTIAVSNGVNDIIASTVNRILQLNNLNALSNATISLDAGQASPVSFAAAANTAPFNLGALAGKASQTLLDTAGSPVTLSVGGNNASSTYAGALTDGGNLVKVGSGTLIFTGTNTYYGATTINGGSLQLGNGGGGGSLNSGSTLTLNGNLTINRNNAVAQGVDFSGSPIAGTGTFTQAGSGTTILNAANSYGGATTVAAGELVVSTAQTGTGPLTVANGAQLDIAVAGGSQLSPTTMTLGASGATTLEFDSLNSTATAPLNVGTLSVGGQVTVDINSGTFAAGNSYPLVHWTGSGPANASSFTLGVSPGLTATFSVAGSTLYLNVAAVSDIWSGAISGNWDTSTANWTGNATIFANGQAVLFDDTAVGPTTITVTAPVRPGNITFNNSTLAYTINSSGADNIGGSGGLTMLNNGSLTLSGGANTYTGPTTINYGTLSAGVLAASGSASDIGAAGAASANLVLNGGTLQYTGGSVGTDHGATLGAGGGTVSITSAGTVLSDSGAIAGSGPLIATGNGTLILSGASTFSGGVTLNAGELNIDNGGTSSANSAIGVGLLTLLANTTIDNTSGSDVTLLPNNPQVWAGSFTYAGSANNLNLGAGPVSLPGACTVTVNGNTLTVGGAISGAGGLTKTGPGTLVLSSASTFSGGMDLQAGTVAVGSDSALGTGLLNFDGGTTGSTIQSIDGTAHTLTNALNFAGANAVAIFGGTGNLKFTSTPTANGTAKTLVVNNPRTEFSGVLGGASARTVGGTGTLVLSGANTYSAGTTINPGATLQLGNGGTNGSLSTSGAIDDEGTLTFDRSNAVVQGVDFSASPITGAGSVVQAGPGTTTLNAANAYSGLTTVNSGELFITPAYQGAGNVFVGDGAKFGVSASLVTNSAMIGSLTLGSGGATALDFSYGLTGNPTNAALVAGAVTINGTSAIRIGGTFVPGTFPVLKYSSLSGAFATTVAGPRGVIATLVNDTVNQVLKVTVSSVGNGIVWTGTNSASPDVWDLNTTTNWEIGGIPTDYIENVPPGDAVTFNDQGSGLVLLSNTVSPANVTISNALVNYTFQGSGQITSPGSLTKVGAATVTLDVPGTFSSGTVVSNGTISISANQAFANLSGNGAVTASTGTPTLTVNDTLNTAFSGGISGTLTLTKNGSGELAMTGSNSFTGNLFVSGGAVTLDSGFMSAGNYCSIGHSGTDIGTLNLKGGALFDAISDFNVGDVGAAAGTFNIQDTADLAANAVYVGSANGTGSTASGTVNQTGGKVTEQSTTAGTFCIGGRTSGTSVGAVGTYNLSGGAVSAASTIRVGAVGTGTFEQTGGTVAASAGVDIATAAGAVGTYNLDGGTLMTLSVVSSSGANSTLNFNGGVLMPITGNTNFVTGVAQINVRNGGLVVDTAGSDVAISATLAHSSISGDNVVDGGLIKRGAGTLTLSATGSYYNGPTVVTAGALNLLPNAVSSLNDLSLSGAALGLVLSGGTLSVPAGNLNLAGNSELNLDYGLVSGTPAAAIIAGGNLTVSGTTVINLSAYGFTTGQFPLVQYSGAPLANLNNFVLGSLPVGVTASLFNNTANKSIDLVVTAVGVSNWIPLLGSDPFGASSFNTGGEWQDGNAPSAGNGYYDIYQLRTPADANPYTFGGSVLAIDMYGRFLMKGTGGQVITVPTLALSGGVADYAVSTGDNLTETLAGAITLGGGFTSYLGAAGSANNSETLFVNATVSGNGSLQLGGTNLNVGADVGVVVLAGQNTYTGVTVVSTGTLLVNGANGNSPVTVNANATLGGTGSIGGPVMVQPSGILEPGTPSRGALTAASGTLTVSGTATIAGTVLMKINQAAGPSSDELNAPSVVIDPGAALVVTNLGSTSLVAGDVFTLFSTPVSGAFSTVTLPALPGTNVYWTNTLAVNGSIAVVAVVTVNPNPTNIIAKVSSGNLTLSWPPDHTGWTLQVQTNSLRAGLGTNWVDVPNSSGTNTFAAPINTGNGSVFYRLKL